MIRAISLHPTAMDEPTEHFYLTQLYQAIVHTAENKQIRKYRGNASKTSIEAARSRTKLDAIIAPLLLQMPWQYWTWVVLDGVHFTVSLRNVSKNDAQKNGRNWAFCLSNWRFWGIFSTLTHLHITLNMSNNLVKSSPCKSSRWAGWWWRVGVVRMITYLETIRGLDLQSWDLRSLVVALRSCENPFLYTRISRASSFITWTQLQRCCCPKGDYRSTIRPKWSWSGKPFAAQMEVIQR